MRLALHPTGEVGHRAGLILLAEAGLEALGIYGHRGPGTEDRRCTAVNDLTGFAVLASDDATAPLDLAGIAAEDGLSCVLAADVHPDPALAARFAEQRRTLLVAASLPGLAEALACREVARSEGSPEVAFAWTRPGRAVRRGEAVPFPDPVGACWGTRLPRRADDPPLTTRIEVPMEGPWAGALVRLVRREGGPVRERIVGVADDRRHLEALALAGGALTVAEGGFSPGVHRPAAGADAYLGRLLGLGLEVASFTRRA
jgi:hypothetical protein